MWIGALGRGSRNRLYWRDCRRCARYELPATAGCQVVALDTPGSMIEVMATAVAPEA